jgi:hypothetical protein
MGGGGGAKFSWAQGFKKPKNGPGPSQFYYSMILFVLKPSFSRRLWTYYALCIFRCVVSIQQVHENGKILGARYRWENTVVYSGFVILHDIPCLLIFSESAEHVSTVHVFNSLMSQLRRNLSRHLTSSGSSIKEST